jgi:hypothetical protein
VSGAPPREATIQISQDAVYEVLDGEAVVLNLTTGNYYRLNAVGTRAWELIDEHRDLMRVREAMLDEFDVTPDVLDRDLDNLVGELTAMGLLITS